MDLDPASLDSQRRIIRRLTIGSALAGAAWMIAVAFSLRGWLVPVLLVALFAAVSFGILVLLAVWKRTREIWTAIKSDGTPQVYLMLTTLGAVAGSMFTLEGWVLIATGYFPWMPASYEWVLVLTFSLPVLWPVVRLADLKRWFPPRV